MPYSLLFIISCGVLVSSCATPQTQPVGVSQVLSLQKIDCQSCGTESVTVLKKVPGVYAVSFEKNTAELEVRYDPKQTGPNQLLATVRDNGFDVELGTGKGFYLPFHKFPDHQDVRLISHRGEAVTIRDHLVSGKVTVVDFFAKWCGPCRKVSDELHKILDKNKAVAVRNINIVDWDRPVAKQYLAKIPELPYVIIYAPNGTKSAEIIGLDLKKLNQAIENASKQ